jgi:hypothetical protein
VLVGNGMANHHGLTAHAGIDRLSRRFFPTDGWALRARVTDNHGDRR